MMMGMTRRNLFAALAGLPFVGRCFFGNGDPHRATDEDMFLEHLRSGDAQMRRERRGRPKLEYDLVGPEVAKVIAQHNREPRENAGGRIAG